ncbi:MAG TPA: thioredoxin [Deltaproteobacteria bacterium]|nr:thioredoxin [Deltaproteobacteria bacterium]
MKTATDDNFEIEVLKSEKPVLIDFWAPWCGPCKAIGPVIEELAGELKDSVKVMKMNVDDNQKTAVNFGVRSIPTIILFKDGKVVDSIIGLVAKEKILELVKKG